MGLEIEEAEANAHYLVKAANAHEGLREALWEVARTNHSKHNAWVTFKECSNSTCKMARAALALAEKE